MPVTPLDDVISSTLKRNWRGNHKEAALRGRDDDPFVYTIDDVYARVWADRSGARTSMETFLSVSEEATGMTLLG